MKKIISVTLLAAAAAICSLAFAVDEKPTVKSEHVMYSAADLKWGDAPASLPAGGFAVMPVGMQHFAGSKAGCVVQVESTGPFEIKYVNPADDPRGAKK